MTKAEKETTLRWDSEQKVVSIFSCHPAIWRRVERAGFQPVRVHRQHGREIARAYKIPLALFRFRVRRLDQPPRKAPSGAFRKKTDVKTRGKGGEF